MSVIVAKSTTCCSNIPAAIYTCFPAIVVTRTVQSATTVVIDGIPTSGFRGAKWDIIVATAGGDRVRSYEVFAGHRNGASPAHVEYSFMGDVIGLDTSITVVGGIMNLVIANSDTVDVIVYATRKAIPTTNSSTIVSQTVEIANIDGYLRPNQTQTYDFLDTTYVGCKWIITVTDAVGHTASTEVFAQLLGVITANDYGRVGDYGVPFETIVTQIPGVGVELAIRNDSSVGYKIDITRIPVPTADGVPSCGPSRGLSMWTPSATTIPSGTSQIVDVIDSTTHSGVKWLVSVYQPSDHKTMLCEVSGAQNANNTYAIVADYFPVSPTISTSVGNTSLTLSNTGLVPLVVNLLRVPVAA